MAFCKYCDDEIFWRNENTRWVPFNPDDSRHSCRTGERKPRAQLYVTDDAPIEVVRAAYRALALKYHPDKGGSNEDMKRLNAIYESVMNAYDSTRAH